MAGSPRSSSDVTEAPQEQPEHRIELVLEPQHMAGVWANWARINHSEHEFTLDFVRLDHSESPPRRGIFVARVGVSPLFITQLIDLLQANWSSYAAKAMPKEVRGGDEPGGSDVGSQEA
jgi:hypothetical protein